MDMMRMMREAQKLQSRMQQEMEGLRVSASSGGGAVEATVNGHKKLLSLKIDPSAVGADVEMLQDLVVAAVNEAGRKVEEEMQRKLGGLGLPGMR
jgi:hypothetical protein